ncbi:MAG TPA: hypothetical protein VEG08_10875 [Terriglobales bacterium]|nr:hypothetical protein [Terriglobales bacterium]
MGVTLIAKFVGALIGGVLFGLVPFFVARSRGQQGLGVAGLICCIVGSLFLGLFLSVPCALVFTIVALVRKPAAPTGGPPAAPGAGGAPPPTIG